ncbi:unnamed protein product [Phytophthora fragariaefolia]|uniref:Unnamed protein product n=1 Tax=Phytophthora fragariaefolia TaxID=1490495 RepID=A0A9W6Y877_9STRA|nr:unnamed protein product [Phytophthora fragariaefolia]
MGRVTDFSPNLLFIRTGLWRPTCASKRRDHRDRGGDSEEGVESDEEWVDSPVEGVDSAEDSSGTSRSTCKQRRSDASSHPRATESSEEPVVLASPLEKNEFPSWDALEAYLKSYSADTYQINVCVQVVNSAAATPTFVLRITSARLEHNHPLNRLRFEYYSHNRTALDSEVVGTASELVKAGAKKKRILQFIHDNSSCNPTIQDVHNLVRKLKKRNHSAPIAAKRLKQWMAEICQEPGNVGGVFVDSVNDQTVATCITLQTQHMRDIFHRLPEVVMIDATHGTNLSKYKVFSIMAHDAFGTGQFVQHAIVQNERNPTLSTALEEFKRNNPAWNRIKSVLVDKDFGEIGVLTKAFPDATLLLCQFHVLKYLREQIASKDYGFNAWQKQQLDGLVNLLVYAKTERQYVRLRKFMGHIMVFGAGKVPVRSTSPGEIELGSGRAEVGSVGGAVGGEVGDQLGSGRAKVGAVESTVGGESECGGDEVVVVSEESQEFKHLFEAYVCEKLG